MFDYFKKVDNAILSFIEKDFTFKSRCIFWKNKKIF